MKMLKWAMAAGLVACAAYGRADTIVTATEDVIHGSILGVHGGNVEIETAFAGALTIPRDQVKSMTFDDANREKAFYARTDAASKAKNEVRVGNDAQGNAVLVPVAGGANVAMSEVQSLWAADAEDPDYPPIKLWSFTLGAGVNGSSGNTEELSVSLSGEAVRTTENATLKLYGLYNKTRSGEVLTAEQYIGGLDAEYRMSDASSFYVRDEIQHNRFSDYHLRNVAAAGYGHYFINATTEGRNTTLRARIGLSHSYTRHYAKDATGDRIADDDLGLDLGLLFHHDFACGLSWNTELTYIPLIDDLGEGTLIHDTNLKYTLTELGRFDKRLSDIALAAGVRNEHKTDPEPGYCKTDTVWYLRLNKTW